MLGRADANFSLSGLKTAVRQEAEQRTPLSDRYRQRSLRRLPGGGDRLDRRPAKCRTCDYSATRFGAARRRWSPPAASPPTLRSARRLRASLPKPAFPCCCRRPNLCTDNGAMIAWAGAERLALGLDDALDTAPRARWRLDETAAVPAQIRQHARKFLSDVTQQTTIAVVGAGAWGTALRQGLGKRATAGDADRARCAVAAEVARTRTNPKLAGVRLDDAITIASDIALAGRAAIVLVATPAQGLRTAVTALAPHVAAGVPLVACAKGIEHGTRKFMTEIIAEVAPSAQPAILSGPSFADDVARGLPTAVTIASRNDNEAAQLAQSLRAATFRPYHTDDVQGRRDRRRCQERARDRSRHRRRQGPWRQRSGSADDARLRRAVALRPRPRRPSRKR